MTSATNEDSMFEGLLPWILRPSQDHVRHAFQADTCGLQEGDETVLSNEGSSFPSYTVGTLMDGCPVVTVRYISPRYGDDRDMFLAALDARDTSMSIERPPNGGVALVLHAGLRFSDINEQMRGIEPYGTQQVQSFYINTNEGYLWVVVKVVRDAFEAGTLVSWGDDNMGLSLCDGRTMSDTQVQETRDRIRTNLNVYREAVGDSSEGWQARAVRQASVMHGVHYPGLSHKVTVPKRTQVNVRAGRLIKDQITRKKRGW